MLNANDYEILSVKRFPKTEITLFVKGDDVIMLAKFQPGWRWSECVGTILGVNTCSSQHVVYGISGRFHVEADDGSWVIEYGAGEFAVVPPEHDGWVLGDEPAVFLDFTGGKKLLPYAEKKPE